MIRLFQKVLAFLIALSSAAVLVSPFWPTGLDREFFLFASIRLLLILAALYVTFALAEFIHDRWKSGML
jgi:uncharacterized membrane protein YjjP (DUF1212 family)